MNAPESRPIGELRDEGLLWLINRVVFHPRGFALAFDVEVDGTVTGWTMQGTGVECWTFSVPSDDDGFERAEAFLRSLRDAWESA